jgi:hypothetical protein
MPEGTSVLRVLHALRFVASFALLGAVLSGVAVGWIEQMPWDPRIAGAAIGALAGIVAKATHAL